MTQDDLMLRLDEIAEDFCPATPGQLAALPPGALAPTTETRSDMTEITDWAGCYDNGWKGLITDAAFAHPAKFAHGLIKRIYQHLLSEGGVQPGDVVIDPFGGVGLGAIYALQNGLHWVGCELEQKFVDLGNENINLWNSRYAAHFPRWGSARLLQGDSRRLASVVSAAAGLVGSPPYAGSLHINESPKKELERMKKRGLDSAITKASRNGGFVGDSNKGYGQTPGQLASLPPGSIEAVVSSPPFAGNSGGRGEASRNGIDAALFDRHGGGMKGGTGADPANLDNLPMGQPPSSFILHPSSLISSPPFAGSVGSDDPAKRGGLLVSDPKRAGDVNLTGSYGETPGQLGGMPVGAVVGSPPYEKTVLHDGGPALQQGGALHSDYGDSPANIGNDSGETFWSAARLIVEQCALLLPPGAPAVWVVKSYVKNGAIVDFPGQWQALCEACGFETVHIHRAWLVKRNGSQATMDGGMVSKDVARKSFFRRLAESKQKMAKHWVTLTREDQAALLWASHGELWDDYRRRLALPEEKQAPRVTRTRILGGAQGAAWERDGRPDYEIATSIDYEVILCTRKRATL